MLLEKPCSLRPQPDTIALNSLQALYDAGRYLDAWHESQAFAPIEQWTSTAALVLAGRLASNWGDPALSNRLHLRAHLHNQQDDTAFYFYILTTHSKHGVFESLRRLSERTATFKGDPATLEQADLWIQQARLLGCFRDFDASETCIARVQRSFPDHPWLWTEKSGLLREQDRYEESLAAAREATRLHPWYRPAIQAQVHLLQLLDRDDEALALLEEALIHLQSGSLVQTLVLALEEKARHADMLIALDRLGELHPLENKSHQRWRAARRCDAAYRLGDVSTALSAAREAGPGYYEKIIQKLSVAPEPGDRRVQLPVGFVRQHHMTCAPATMAALSRYWGSPIDHLELAREICYDGTPAHLERAWAEKHGWHVREFCVTWETVRDLIDRGCPFAIVTVGIRSGHMQAVIGYDSRLGTLLIRDPYQRSYGEWQVDTFFKSHESSGPRGFLMLPPEKTHLLEGLDLPDAAYYDHLHSLQLALSRHDHNTAASSLAWLQSADDTHLITLRARYEIACYDSNYAQALIPLRGLRERFPDDANYQLDELQLLGLLGLTEQHRELLRRWGNRPAAPAIFMRMEAEELIRDARSHTRAFKVLRRALRRQATDARTLAALACLLQENNRHDEAMYLHRLAACAADKIEHHWTSYFQASRHLRKTEESLALLKRRFETWGDRSGQPAHTLFESLEAFNRAPEAFAVLDAARTRRPDDGDLLIFSAEAHGRYGRQEEALQLITAATTKVAPSTWRRTAATLAHYQGDHSLALAHWREILALNPADINAHQSVARLLSIVKGSASARLHLESAVAQQPHLLPLRQALVQWLREDSNEQALTALDALLTMDPANAWAHREKSIILRLLQRTDEALACAEEALRIAPYTPSSHGIHADALRQLGRLAEAREGYRAGIRLSIDADWMFSDLLAACSDFSTRHEAVVFLRKELQRQTSLNNACLHYRSTARDILTPAELRTDLENLLVERPESWSTWSALSSHLLDQGEIQSALARANEAATRFPLTPRIWLDLANILNQQNNTEAASSACEKALAISPAWGSASRLLSKIHERTLRLDLAAEVLQRAIELNPTDAQNHGWLADVLWRQHEHNAALAAIEKAVQLSPDYSWAWSRLDNWAKETGDSNRAIQLAEKLTLTRPGESESWLRLVRLRFTKHAPEANLEALDRAESLSPCNIDVHDLRAEVLATCKRYEEALAACRPAVFGDSVPQRLEGRAAWIEYHRGRLTKAIERMSAVTSAHPDYTWGWSLLTEWYWEDQKFESVKTAATRWAWLAPDAALPHGYIATVHKQDGRKKEARESLARAIAVDPTYEFGAFELLRLQLDDDELENANQTVRHIETHFPKSDHLRAVLIMQRSRKDRKAVVPTLQKLGRLPDLQEGPLQSCVNVVTNSGWESEIEIAFAPLLKEADTSPLVGRQWLLARQKKSLWLTLWKLRQLHPTPAHRRDIDCAIIESLGQAQRVLALRIVCILRRRPLRAHDEPWGQVGYAFNASNRFRSVTRWMHDWRERPAAPPWMRFNFIQACYGQGKVAEARDALKAALLCPPDHTHDKLLCWLACEQALAGETTAALATADRINTNNLTDYYHALLAFTQCLTSVQNAPPNAKRAKLDEARERLKSEIEKTPTIQTGHALSKFYRRTLRRLGHDGDSIWWRVRSHLPSIKPLTSHSTEFKLTPGMIWLIIILLSGITRSCSSAMR